MPSLQLPPRALLLVAVCILTVAIATTPALAFGAGNIPGYSALEGKAFRHGDIDDTLAQLAKKAGGLLGRGSKFSGLDIKRVYLGSWLADMSQAMDIGSLERVSKQSVLNIVAVMAFLAFGYATGDFEVTLERLNAYLPVEHIDNPKGYGGGKDPRQVDPRLRPPIDPRELEIDGRTGMKNYIANESGSWDTSSALVRRRLVECIQLGRRARSSGDKSTLYEAFRLLGRCLHTLEDFPAHSNFCELALLRMGHRDVFSHVGDGVKVRAPDGSMAPPLVTGTFGGADFIHSLLGEASDHLSSASVSEIQKTVRDASAHGSGSMRDFMTLLGNVPGGAAGSLSRDAQSLSNGPSRDPETMDPQEIYRNIYQIMAFRDKVMMFIEETIEKIPGLSSLIEKISNTLSVFVFTLLEPYINPIIKQALGGLQMGSSQVINEQDQYEVFNNPQASDPTHSILSKDHFGLVLNEPAGNLACIIVRHVVTLVVKAWDDTSINELATADECLAVLFHPSWPDRQRCHPVQAQMLGYMDEWGRNNPTEVRKLDRQHVRAHTNTRSGRAESHSCGGTGSSYGVQSSGQQGYGMGSGMAHQVVNTLRPHIPGGAMFREVPGAMNSGEQGSFVHGGNSGKPSATFSESKHETHPSQFPGHATSQSHGDYGMTSGSTGNSVNYDQQSHRPPSQPGPPHYQQQYAPPSFPPGQNEYQQSQGATMTPHGGSYPGYSHQFGPPQGPPPPPQQQPFNPGPPYGYPGPGYNQQYPGPPPPGSGYY